MRNSSYFASRDNFALKLKVSMCATLGGRFVMWWIYVTVVYTNYLHMFSPRDLLGLSPKLIVNVGSLDISCIIVSQRPILCICMYTSRVLHSVNR